MIPIPQTQRGLLDGPKSNAALYFARMTECDGNGRIAQNAIVVLGDRLNSRFPTANTTLAAIHARQAGFLGAAARHAEATGSGLALEIRAKLTSPFVSGLGSGHPTETGLILDRNSGLPYIPASSVKGVMRLACALHIAETEPERIEPEGDQWKISDKHPLLRRYFGDTKTDEPGSARGQLVFLDAFPAETSGNLLKADIMNPHFGQYYSGAQGPKETENPIPVKFLAVKEGTEFVFRCFASPLPENAEAALNRPFDKTDEQHVTDMFRIAFADLGFGGKTAIGYGRFAIRNIKDAPTLLKEFTAEQERKRLAEEGQKYPWRPLLAGIDQADWVKLRQQYLDNKALQEHQSNPEVGAKVRDAAAQLRKSQRKKWKEDRDAFLKAWLEPAGIAWPPEEGVPPSDTGKPAAGGETPPDVSELARRIRDMGQQDYLNGKFDLNSLGLPEALALQGKLKEWGFNDRKAKDNKKTHWQNLQKRIRELGQ